MENGTYRSAPCGCGGQSGQTTPPRATTSGESRSPYARQNHAVIVLASAGSVWGLIPSACWLVATEHVSGHFPGTVCLPPIDDQVFALVARASPTRGWHGEAVLTDAVGKIPRHIDERRVERDVGPTSVEQALPELADRLA